MLKKDPSLRKNGIKLFAWLLALTMMLGMLPAAALGENTQQAQIGKHFEADYTTGALAETPQLPDNTSKSYADGWVLTNKTIAPGEKENEFWITLDVRTKEEIEEISLSEDAAVVIVLDLSGSMNNYGRIEAAKDAAEAFVTSFAETKGENAQRKVAVVGFSGWPNRKDEPDIVAAKTYQSWIDSDETKTIEEAIDSMQAVGGTCLQAGLILAKNLLNDTAVADIENKNIVVLTDGRPTYYLNPTAQGSTSITEIGKNTSGYYNNLILGDGTDTDHDTHTETEKTAKSIVDSGIHVYGVYLGSQIVNCTKWDCDLYKTGAKWLRDDCGFITYAADDVDNLTQIFEHISELIALQAQAWIANDPIGELFTFGGFQNPPIDSNEYFIDTEGREITWRLFLSTPRKTTMPDGSTVYEYLLTYKIKLNTLHIDYSADKHYATNGKTSVTYLIQQTTQSGTTQIDHGTAYFNVPSAMGYAADVSFKKVDENGEPLPGATFTLTTKDDLNWVRTATSGNDGKVQFNSVPSGHIYTLQETIAPDGYALNDEKYEISVSYGESNGTIGDNDTVQNTPVIPEPEYGDLTVKKTVSGDGADTADEFTFTVTVSENGDGLNDTYGDMEFANGTATFTLKDGESKEAIGLPDGVVFTVTETNYDGYTVTINGVGLTTEAAATSGIIVAGQTTTIVFNNDKDAVSIPSPTTFTPKALKTLDGFAPSGSAFRFTLESEGDIIQTVQNNGGDVVFDPLTFSDTGTYTYTLSEVKGTDESIRYDASVYTITIEVEMDEATNTLKCSASYQKDGKPYDGTPVFANLTVMPPQSLPKTGDASQIGLWLSLALLSMAGFALILKRRWQRR